MGTGRVYRSGRTGDSDRGCVDRRDDQLVVHMSDLLCRSVLVGALVIMLWLAYRWRIRGIALEKEFDALYFDPDDAADRWEYKAIMHQRSTGRELGPELRWIGEDED